MQQKANSRRLFEEPTFMLMQLRILSQGRAFIEKVEDSFLFLRLIATVAVCCLLYDRPEASNHRRESVGNPSFHICQHWRLLVFVGGPQPSAKFSCCLVPPSAFYNFLENFKEITFLIPLRGMNTDSAKMFSMVDPSLPSSPLFRFLRCSDVPEVRLKQLFGLHSRWQGNFCFVPRVERLLWPNLVPLSDGIAILHLLEKYALSSLQASPIASTAAWKTLHCTRKTHRFFKF